MLGDFQRRHLYDTSWKIGGADLVQRNGQCFLHITQTKADPTPDEPTGFLGIDLGIVNLAADSDGAAYSGAQVQTVRERRFWAPASPDRQYAPCPLAAAEERSSL